MSAPRLDPPRGVSDISARPVEARRRASHVPLPAYAQPVAAKPAAPQRSASSKLMSLNSAILAAQRNWEQQNQIDSKSGDNSDYSESGGETVTDHEVSPEPEDLTAAISEELERPPKRPLDAETVGSSFHPSKRVNSDSFGHFSALSPSAWSSSGSGTPSHGQQPLASRLSEVDQGKWLVYTPYDSIRTRADGIPYDYYRADKDRLASMLGALVPTKYKPDKRSIYPFFCPDRNCTKAYASERQLGGHFSSGHKGTAYNDNCDGTFSKVGIYPKVAGEPWRAIVVSRINANEAGEGEEEIEREDEEEEEEENEKEREQPVATTPVLFTEADIAVTHPDPFSYITSFLPLHSDYANYMTKEYVQELCQLPKRRNLPHSWTSFHVGKKLTERMFALAAAYITGREVFGMDECDKGLHEAPSKLSHRSVAIPFELSARNKAAYFPHLSCLGCYYYAETRKTPNACSWQSRDASFLLRYDDRVDGLVVSDDEPSNHARRGIAAEVAQRRRAARAVDAAIKAGKAAKFNCLPRNPTSRVSQQVGSGQQSPALSPLTNGFDYQFGNYAAQNKPTTQGEPTTTVPYHQVISAESGRASRSSTTLRKLAQEQPMSPVPTARPDYPVQTPPTQLQMEDWEIAPGRMVDPTHGENIGYSNAYLNGREPVEVSEDISFNVLTIKPGDKARWEAHESQLRTCSVASGKIEIKIGSKKFGAGPNSMFIIRPGETGVVTNQMYNDATIHCTTVKNYSLLS